MPNVTHLGAHGVSGGTGLLLSSLSIVSSLVLGLASGVLRGAGQVAGLVLGSLRVVASLVLALLCLRHGGTT